MKPETSLKFGHALQFALEKLALEHLIVQFDLVFGVMQAKTPVSDHC